MRIYKNREWLRQKYRDEELSLVAISQLVSRDPATIRYWMKKFGIARRPPGSWGRGKNHPRWRGGRYRDGCGYIRVYAPEHPNAYEGRYFLEHRLVVEKALGRYLESGELVHHINGKRDDNRLGNLELVDRHKRRICPRCGWPMGDLPNLELCNGNTQQS